ncbi:MAG: hypothetical protein JRD94_18110 [Deltaproteobacteria bacterium]|nr:hypothetical protein [Deltaproteobacteria bacterium]
MSAGLAGAVLQPKSDTVSMAPASQKQSEQPEAGSTGACRRCGALALVATPVIEPMRRLPEKTEIFFRVVDVLGPAAEAYPHGVGVVVQSINEIRRL